MRSYTFFSCMGNGCLNVVELWQYILTGADTLRPVAFIINIHPVSSSQNTKFNKTSVTCGKPES